jgi:hypothetical protein
MKKEKAISAKNHIVHNMTISFDIKNLKITRRYITMESVMKNGFAELSADEMNDVDGGSTGVFIETLTACLALGKLAFECGEKIGRTFYAVTH